MKRKLLILTGLIIILALFALLNYYRPFANKKEIQKAEVNLPKDAPMPISGNNPQKTAIATSTTPVPKDAPIPNSKNKTNTKTASTTETSLPKDAPTPLK
jgi:flagellar basal body-associated protein FliL